MKLKIMMLVLLVWLCFMQPVYADAYSCISDLTSDPDFQPIKNKVALGAISEQTFGMLANEAIPTPDEAQAISKWGTKREQCLKSYPLPSNNPYRQNLIDGFNATQLLVLKLYKSNLSYGEFAKQRQEIANAVEDSNEQIRGQYQQQQAQQQQSQQQQQRQFCETRYQQCMNRAFDVYSRSACQIELGGCQIGGALNR